MHTRKLTWDWVEAQLSAFESLLHGGSKQQIVYGIPRGGMILAGFLKNTPVTNNPADATIFLDDIIDSGATKERYLREYPNRLFIGLIDKTGINKNLKDWIQFPWESEEAPEDAVIRLLQYLGEDPKREGLQETPKRVLKALTEMTRGYKLDPAAILEKDFHAEYDQMVWLKGIQFTSLCEHHMLPFVGTATIAYIPKGRVVGISKLARLVECFACRLQIQEKMTHEIAHALQTHLDPKGVGVIIKAHHSCMSCRGVKQPNTEMVTSCILGAISEDSSARNEFLRYV